MNNQIDAYAGGRSIWHRFDPRLKLIGFSSLIVAFGFSSRWPEALVALAISVGLAVTTGLPIRFMARRVREPALFLALFPVILPLSHPGGWAAGFEQGLTIGLKGLAMVGLLFPMLGTQRFDLTMKALSRLGLSQVLTQLVLFAYRYLFLFGDELTTTRRAQRARGFSPAMNIQTIKTISQTAGSMLVRSFDRQERVAQAMIARGYTGRYRSLGEMRASSADWWKITGLLTLAVAWVGWEMELWTRLLS